jgi:hypothetical protein
MATGSYAIFSTPLLNPRQSRQIACERQFFFLKRKNWGKKFIALPGGDFDLFTMAVRSQGII